MVEKTNKLTEEVKKTAEAHGTTSEEISESKAVSAEDVSKEMIEKENVKEDAKEMTEEEREKKAQVLEEKDKEEKKVDNNAGGRGRGRQKRSFGPTTEEIIAGWAPKTKLGEEVKNEKIKNIDEILDSGKKILEPEIVDKLMNAKSDLISIGQSKGKFGGGKRRAWRQTQRKTKEGNVATFSTMAIVGDENGHIGIGTGRSKETLPARDKAVRKAKLNIIRINRACSAFDCACSDEHTVPFKVTGKAGSVRVTLIPAPQGTGLIVGRELKKILKMAGIKDVYSKTDGRKRTTFNFAKACVDALSKTVVEDKK